MKEGTDWRFPDDDIDSGIIIPFLYRSGSSMNVVTVSPKYQVVIPKEIRERIGLVPGQRLQVFAFEDRIELVPLQPIESLRGFLKGIDTNIEREPDRV